MNKIDLVLLNQDVVYHLPSVFASIVGRVPCVVRKAGIGTGYQAKRMWHFLSYFPAEFIASSNAEYLHHLNMGLPFKKMVTVFEGVDLEEFVMEQSDPELRDALRIPDNAFVVGSISRIAEGKGHEDFIAAAAQVIKQVPGTMFLIVGDGDQNINIKLHNLVDELGIDGNVFFSGWRTDTEKLLRIMHVFVHCPNKWREGMGIATLEALACGKPVIITDNWGLAETTVDGYNGFVVSVGDYAKIAEKIILLLKNPQLREQMGRNSRIRAEKIFDIRKNVNIIENILAETYSDWKN
jgi:glycosyltransferase involved in cell wall biosynthesis